jgi:hypothetical protein
LFIAIPNVTLMARIKTQVRMQVSLEGRLLFSSAEVLRQASPVANLAFGNFTVGNGTVR